MESLIRRRLTGVVPKKATKGATMDVMRGLALVLATITMGLVTGAFALYAHTIMPALRGTDDRTFVGAFQAMDRSIINPWFMAGGFVGAALFTGLAGALFLGGG